VPTRSDLRPTAPALFLLTLALAGCGEPSDREVGNARAFEALLTAVSLRDAPALEAASGAIERRHEAGELSGANHGEITAIIARGRARDWSGAVALAYRFRGQFGDRGAYFR